MLQNFIRRLLFVLIAMFIADSVWSGGFPLFWYVTGDGRTHGDFGIPTFHGAFHGILLFFAISSYFLFRQKFSRKENLRNCGLFVCYAVIVFNRGIIIIFMLQALFIYLVTGARPKLSTVLPLLVVFIITALIFGVLGDYRSGGNVFASVISDNWSDFFDIFPKSLMWFYVYATGGLNNLYFNIPTVTPTYVPFYTFAKLVPSVAYDWLDMHKAYDLFSLADQRLTVSTAFHGLVSDFGVVGVLFFLPIVLIAQVSYRRALSGSSVSILYYGILMEAVVMTPYIDTVFYLTFFLQLSLVTCCALCRPRQIMQGSARELR